MSGQESANLVGDINSTPLDKLGSMGNPEFADKKQQPSSTDYAEVLKAVDIQRDKPAPPQMPPTAAMMQPPGLPYESVVPRISRPRVAPARPQRRRSVATSRPVAPVVRPSQGRIDVKFLRPALVVAAVVFVMLRNVAPQIAKRLPMSVDLNGKFTIPGLLIISLLSGGLYLGLTELVTRLQF